MKLRHAIFAALFVSALTNTIFATDKIDRRAVVERHNIRYGGYNARLNDSPSQVGNGKFAFGFDRTGLQTLAPQCTLSDWAWHSTPPPDDIAKFAGDTFASPQRNIAFAHSLPDPKNPRLSQWLAANPHRLNLARIGFKTADSAENTLDSDSIVPRWQTVNMYTGIVESSFTALGESAHTTTVSHPERDIVAARVTSKLLKSGKLKVFFRFPYADAATADSSGDWNVPQKHSTSIEFSDTHGTTLKRILDADTYFATIKFSNGAKLNKTNNPHEFELSSDTDTLEFICEFTAKQATSKSLPTFDEAKIAYKKMWSDFWQNGAFIDLGASSDPRWKELERRIITSQYLMRINCVGLLPPQESGLRENSWYGRFHLEMIWWHSYHWLLWERPQMAENILSIYRNTLAYAKEIAAGQGYAGARWPKCMGNIQREWPHPIHAFLIWQQPHPIFFAEAQYRANPSKQTLEKWADIVFETAEFMADLPIKNTDTGQYNLEPPLYIVSENTDPKRTRNPAFELGYWRYGLSTAIQWRKRLGLVENKKWRKVLENLAPIPQKNGVYEIYEGVENMWSKFNWEHPALIGTFGMLRGDGTNADTIRKTLAKIDATWNFDRIWGWDFPMLSMAAIRTGNSERAIDYLLFSTPAYNWDKAGAINTPCVYFPANGGLLAAVAMLANGWDGAPPPNTYALYFPANGKWKVRAEGFKQKHQ